MTVVSSFTNPRFLPSTQTWEDRKLGRSQSAMLRFQFEDLEIKARQ